MEKIPCSNCETQNDASSKYCMNCGYELPKSTKAPGTIQTVTKKPSTSNKAKIMGVLIGSIVSGFTYWGVQQLFFSPPSLDKQLMAVANEINKTCPLMVDSETQMDNSVALPDNVFQYNYTLLTIEKAMVDTVDFKNYMETNIVNQVKTNPQMKFFRDRKVTMNYLYKDRNGEYISLISVSADEYE